MTVLSLLSTFARPALVTLCAMLLFNLPTLVYKIGMLVRGIVYLLFCNDKKWKKPQDPALVVRPILDKETKGDSMDGYYIERKTIYFVRHGESTWNDTFK
jgi:hypothetical protein